MKNAPDNSSASYTIENVSTSFSSKSRIVEETIEFRDYSSPVLLGDKDIGGKISRIQNEIFVIHEPYTFNKAPIGTIISVKHTVDYRMGMYVTIKVSYDLDEWKQYHDKKCNHDYTFQDTPVEPEYRRELIKYTGYHSSKDFIKQGDTVVNRNNQLVTVSPDTIDKNKMFGRVIEVNDEEEFILVEMSIPPEDYVKELVTYTDCHSSYPLKKGQWVCEMNGSLVPMEKDQWVGNRPFGQIVEVHEGIGRVVVERSIPKLKEDKLTKEQYDNITKNIEETNTIFNEIDKLRRK
jgi:hypothetical protein